MRAELTPEEDAIWPNCQVPDCQNKACLGLSNEECFPHFFGLPMDKNGDTIYPDEMTKRLCLRLLDQALKKL